MTKRYSASTSIARCMRNIRAATAPGRRNITSGKKARSKSLFAPGMAARLDALLGQAVGERNALASICAKMAADPLAVLPSPELRLERPHRVTGIDFT